MRRIGVTMMLCVAATLPLLAQSIDAWRHWRSAMPISTPAPAESRLVGVVIPTDVTAKALPGWDDLRVVDSAGVEQPFVLWAGGSELTRAWRPVRLLDPGFVRGEYSQVVLDLGDKPAVHNRVRLDVTADADFQTWVEIAVGNDARAWQVVRERAPIYDLTRAGIGEKREAAYPASVSRYVRIRLLDGATAFRVAGAAVVEEVTPKIELQASDLLFVPQAGGDRRTTFVSQGSADGVLIAEIRITSTQAQFLRPIAVEASDDGVRWRSAGSSEIARTTVQGETRETLNVPVWSPSSRHWRVVIYDQDDRPLTGVTVRAFVRPRRVVFRETAGQSYRLLFGHQRAPAPQYDMARLLDAAALDAATPATLAAVVVNRDYADPAPWTERHPIVLWAAAGLAVLVLGAIAVRALRGGVRS